MVDKDVLMEKVGQIQNCLRRIKETTGLKAESLDDFDCQDVFVLNLQRAIQSSIDLASHVITDEGWGLPSELRENFVVLEKQGVISPVLSKQLQKMIGFRNLAVHDYSAIDVAILKSILQKNLKDLEDHYTALLKFLGY